MLKPSPSILIDRVHRSLHDSNPFHLPLQHRVE
jgi:hypothetical protein